MTSMQVADAPLPKSMQIIPLQRVAAGFACSERTLVKQFKELRIPILRFSRNVRGVSISDLESLVERMREAGYK